MKKVLVRGPALSQSGYGEHTRFVLRSLKTNENFDIYLVNTPWGATSWLYEDNEERAWIDSLLMKTLQAEKDQTFDLSVQVTIPSEWERVAKYNIGVTAGTETNKISDAWLQKTFAVDKIIVPSEHAKFGFLNNTKTVNAPTGEEVEIKCETPIDVVSYPYKDIKSGEPVSFDTDFNFLTVAQSSPRKNIEASLLAFLEEFQNEPEVGDVLKVGIKNNSVIDREHTVAAINSLLGNYPNRKCKVYLVHGGMSEQEMASLYNSKSICAYVTASHGEGFALPVFEACANGLPVVAPYWGGYTDYCKEENIASVAYEVLNVHEEAVWSGVIEKDSDWAYVKLDDLRAKMRDVYANNPEYQKLAKKSKASIKRNYKAEKQYSKIVNSIMEVVK